MITEDYCSFEVAKLLKEKGFDENCRAYWDSRIDDLPKEYEIIRFTEEPIYQPYDNMHSIRKRYLAPTHQMAMKWLREVHKIDVWVEGWNRRYKSNIHSEQRGEEALFYEDSYEAACESALKYCLENLI